MNRRHFVGSTMAAAIPSAMEAAGRIRIAFLGGIHSHALAKAKLLTASQDFEFAGIWEEDPKARSRYEAMGIRPLPLDQILQDKAISAVAVESDVADHARHALLALEAGKHVHVEKPPADNLADFRKMVQLAASKRLQLQTGYMWRYNPGFVKALEAARNGWLGEVYHVHGVMNTQLAAQRRPEWGRFAGGQMFEQGGYLVDAIVRLLGRPSKVTPWLRRDGTFEDRLMDNTVAVLEFPRALAVIRCAALQPNAALHRSFEIQGTNGNAVLRPIEDPELQVDLAAAAGPYKKGQQRVALEPYVRFEEDWSSLAAAIRGERALPVSLEGEMITQETLLRACGVIKD